MNPFPLLTRSRLAQLALFAVLVALAVLLPGATVDAAPCSYTHDGVCLDPVPLPEPIVLERYFVVEYGEDCEYIYDVLVVTNRPRALQNVMDPIRSHTPNLRAYNAASGFPKAVGEVKMWDFLPAVANGTVHIVRKDEIYSHCGDSYLPFPDVPEACDEALPPIPPYGPYEPWEVEELVSDDGELTTFADLQPMENQDCPSFSNPDLPIPEGTFATFLLVDENQLDTLVDLLAFE